MNKKEMRVKAIEDKVGETSGKPYRKVSIGTAPRFNPDGSRTLSNDAQRTINMFPEGDETIYDELRVGDNIEVVQFTLRTTAYSTEAREGRPARVVTQDTLVLFEKQNPENAIERRAAQKKYRVLAVNDVPYAEWLAHRRGLKTAVPAELEPSSVLVEDED